MSADGSRLITGRNWEGERATAVPIKLWDVATQRQLLSLGRLEEVGHPSQVGFLPDGSGIFAVAERGLHVWTAPTLAEIETANEAR